MRYDLLLSIGSGTDVEEEKGNIPSSFELEQNVPNPFNPSTTIRFSVPEMHQGAHVELTIYDLLGQKVRTLMDASVEAGVLEATWDGKDEAGREVSSGVYFYKLAIDGGKWAETRKMVLIR
jgi:flagellar hook assembly protein FlgD